MQDSELIKNVLQGDQRYYTLIVEKYQSNVFRVAIGFVHNKEDAEEITQDVFVKAYTVLSGFNHQSALATWLYRIAVNASLNFLRSRKRKSIWVNISHAFYLAANEKNAEASMHLQEEWESIRRAVDGLPEKQRTAFILSKYEDLPQRQIAAIMNTTEGSVEQFILRAKRNLQKKLKIP